MSGQNTEPLFSKGVDGVDDFNCAECCICGGRIVVELPVEPGSSPPARPKNFVRFILDRGMATAQFDERRCHFVCLGCMSSGYLTANLISMKIDQAKTERHQKKCVKFYESMQKYMGLLKPLSKELMKTGFADEYEF